MNPTSRAGSRCRSRPRILALFLGLGWGITTGAVAAGPPPRALALMAAQPQALAQAITTAPPNPLPPASLPLLQPQPGDSRPAPLQPAAATLSRPRSIVLNLTSRSISLLDAGAVLGRWPVAVGAGATPTPVGRFAVINKVVNPRYQSTKSGRIHPMIGANGPLGDRWLGFLQSGPNQFGIHGTPAAWSWTVTSRAAVTNGCVRMLRTHVHQLFAQVEVGTPVIVTR